MFTGIVETVVSVGSVRKRKGGLELGLEPCNLIAKSKLGDSISVCGVCLTLESNKSGRAVFYLSPETLKKTWLKKLKPDDPVHLERAARLGAPVGGHLVQGHVDGVGRLLKRTRQGEGEWIEFSVPKPLSRFLLPKGSIAVDGISLTIVDPKGTRFGVAVIPATLKNTILQFKKPGDPVHVEADLVGKWVAQLAT